MSEASHDDQVIVFVNPLIMLLNGAERQKGSPLTEAEVLHIRDNALAIVMTRGQAQRYYAELDARVPVYRMNPERIWDEWQEIRGADRVEGRAE